MSALDLVIDLIEVLEVELASQRVRPGRERRGAWHKGLVYCVQNVAETGVAVFLNRDYEMLAMHGGAVDLADRKSFPPVNQYSAPGYLFNDGTAPWYGRSLAARYLRCLRALRRAMERAKLPTAEGTI